MGNNQCPFFKKYDVVGPAFSRVDIQSLLKSSVLTTKVSLETGPLLHLPGSSSNEKRRAIPFQEIDGEVCAMSKV